MTTQSMVMVLVAGVFLTACDSNGTDDALAA